VRLATHLVVEHGQHSSPVTPPKDAES
jgi:hypothetical protein